MIRWGGEESVWINNVIKSKISSKYYLRTINLFIMLTLFLLVAAFWFDIVEVWYPLIIHYFQDKRKWDEFPQNINDHIVCIICITCPQTCIMSIEHVRCEYPLFINMVLRGHGMKSSSTYMILHHIVISYILVVILYKYVHWRKNKWINSHEVMSLITPNTFFSKFCNAP